MAEQMNILQIGLTDWSAEYDLPEAFTWLAVAPDDVATTHAELEEALDKAYQEAKLADKKAERKKIRYDAVLVTSDLSEAVLEVLDAYVAPYTTFYDEAVTINQQQTTGFVRRKMARLYDMAEPQRFIALLAQILFNGQTGTKLTNQEIEIFPDFRGEVTYNGHVNTTFTGDFGETFQPLFSWRFNFMAEAANIIETWLEFVTSEDCQLQLRLEKVPAGSLNQIIETIALNEEDLSEPHLIKPDGSSYYVSASIFARGSGTISVGALHHRWSRADMGKFIMGGKRFSDSRGQEFIYYMEPGDMKPPLNVYFSGFRPAEGFEGYWMMKSLGSPFMLIGDPRLEGGSFYLGSDELEAKVEAVIRDALDYLGFDHTQLILSGLSMGTFGALYYGAKLLPDAIVVGKPLVNIGDIVSNIKLKRPGQFDTSLDMLRLIEGDIQEADMEHLNDRFWSVFKAADFSQTKIALSYMQDDDYDQQAFPQLVDWLKYQDVQIFGKGYLGRHNDNSPAINQWFISQYHRILEEDFGKEL
ncbi:accessory Sec system protein Asp2 [Streptococcus merionis]|uniref:accessory Sec system protein Asp2 n=1 Tax=Streptococcus merionis TaxID=400065 RepID=UPI0035165159